MKHPVTLQISLAPSDYAHAHLLLAHQIKAWRGQYSELLITIDLHRSAGRFSARWEEGRDRIIPLAESFPGARVLTVDYSQDARLKISQDFFGGEPVPVKDFRGGPYYAYFFGLSAAKHDHVLHTDSDIFFGGTSNRWLEEAIHYMAAHPQILFTAPLPGPPHPSGKLLSLAANPDPTELHAFQFNTMSTRLFLFDRSTFRSRVNSLQRRPPSMRNSLIALLEGNPPEDLPEHLFATAMKNASLSRREFLGQNGGKWSLHPPYRCADFYNKLPELIARVEADEIPDAQLGCHDFNESMVDWSEAKATMANNRLWHRLRRRYR